MLSFKLHVSHVDFAARQDSTENEGKLRRAALVGGDGGMGILMAYYLSSWILQCLTLDHPLGDVFFQIPVLLNL